MRNETPADICGDMPTPLAVFIATILAVVLSIPVIALVFGVNPLIWVHNFLYYSFGIGDFAL